MGLQVPSGDREPLHPLTCFTLLLCKVRGWRIIPFACVAESALHTPTSPLPASLFLPSSPLDAWSDQFSGEQIGPGSCLAHAFSVLS